MNEPTGRTSRRQLLKSAGAVAAFTIVPRHVLGGQGQTPPSEKLNIVGIGAGGQAAADINEISRGANIIALCDADLRTQRRNAPVFSKYPTAKVFQD
jgi:hypothetical protein